MKPHSTLVCFLLTTVFSAGKVLAQNLFQDALSARVQDFVDTVAYGLDCGDIHDQVLRLNFDDTADFFCPDAIQSDVDDVNQHGDAGSPDFGLAAYSWILNRFWDHPLLVANDDLRINIANALINLPYWMEEGGVFDDMQYWSENHNIGWVAGAYLIGNGFDSIPELNAVTFSASGLTGAELRELSRGRVLEWLDYRVRFGITEFNSDTYGGIMYQHILALSHLAPDEDIRNLARGIQILVQFDHVLGSKGDRLCTARGRAYEGGKIQEEHETHIYMLKGGDLDPGYGDSRNVYLVLNYLNGQTQPSAILEIGETIDSMELSLREHFALGADEGPQEGLDIDPVQDCWWWLTDGAYFTPEWPECMFLLGDEFDLWERSNFWNQLLPFKTVWDSNPDAVQAIADYLMPLGRGPVFGPANMHTYRTPEYLISSIQDSKGGLHAGQQHPWQITYDINSGGTVFTQQPMCDNPESEYYWWSGIRPKITQFGATAVTIFNPDSLMTDIFKLNMTHAHFDQGTYDEFDLQMGEDGGGWVFGRYDEFYVGLYSYNFADFESSTDLVASGIENVWIAEVGSASQNGTFEEFKDILLTSTVEVTITQAERDDLSCALEQDCVDGGADFESCMSSRCPDAKTPRLEQCLKVGRMDNEEVISAVLAMAEGALLADTQDGLFHGCGDEDLAAVLAAMEPQDCMFGRVQATDVSLSYIRGDGRQLEVGWADPMTVDGHEIPYRDFPRYDNDFAQVPWGDTAMDIVSQSGYFVELDFDNLEVNFD